RQRQAVGTVEQDIKTLDGGQALGLVAGKDADQLDSLVPAELPRGKDEPVVQPLLGKRLGDRKAFDPVDAQPERLPQGLHQGGIVEQSMDLFGGDDTHRVGRRPRNQVTVLGSSALRLAIKASRASSSAGSRAGAS